MLPGYFPLGDVVVGSHDNINAKHIVAVVSERETDPTKARALSAPLDFEQVWKDTGSGAKTNCTVWRPLPRPATLPWARFAPAATTSHCSVACAASGPIW
jgi:hypothetical protein